LDESPCRPFRFSRLKETGYVEGQNVSVEYHAENQFRSTAGACSRSRAPGAAPSPGMSTRTIQIRTIIQTVELGQGGFHMAKRHLALVSPATVIRTVGPLRRPNAELRTREYIRFNCARCRASGGVPDHYRQPPDPATAGRFRASPLFSLCVIADGRGRK